MREFWINERTGSASLAEESISYGYHTHVIEYSALELLQKENAELKAQLGIAKNALKDLQGHCDASLLFPHKDRIDLLKSEQNARLVLKQLETTGKL